MADLWIICGIRWMRSRCCQAPMEFRTNWAPAHTRYRCAKCERVDPGSVTLPDHRDQYTDLLEIMGE